MSEYDQFRAVRDIYFDGSLAYGFGDFVPATNVSTYGYLTLGYVVPTGQFPGGIALKTPMFFRGDFNANVAYDLGDLFWFGGKLYHPLMALDPGAFDSNKVEALTGVTVTGGGGGGGGGTGTGGDTAPVINHSTTTGGQTFKDYLKTLSPTAIWDLESTSTVTDSDATPVTAGAWTGTPSTGASLIASDSTDKSVLFSGDDYATVDAGRVVSLTSAWTLHFRLKGPAALSGASADQETVYSETTTSGTNGYLFVAKSVNGTFTKARVRWVNDTGTTLFEADSTGSVFDNTSHGLEVSFDPAAGAISFKIDGVADRTVNLLATTGTFTTNAATIGANRRSTTTAFLKSTLVSIVAPFNRLLTSTESTALQSRQVSTGSGTAGVSGVLTVDLAPGLSHTYLQTGNITDIQFTNWPSGTVRSKVELYIKQDSTGGRTINAPGLFGDDRLFPGTIAEANAWNVLEFRSVDNGATVLTGAFALNSLEILT